MSNIAIIFMLVIGSISFIRNLIIGNKETTIPDTIIGAGVGLIVPSALDTVLNVIVILSGNQSPEGVNPYVSLVCGFILLGAGLYLKKNLREKIHVLNMHGITSRDISEASAIKELNLVEYKVKEQVMDFIPFFDGGKISNKTNGFICNQIEKDVVKFTARIADNVGCFTGMAPIPYTIYAGTFMENGNVKRYFEYDGRAGQKKYYELKKATRKQKKQGWKPLVEEFPNNINVNSTEIVLAISISHDVTDANLIQFAGKDIVKLKIQGTSDNIIQSKDQLEDYSKVIYDCINIDIDSKYPSLEKIHIVASIPSCVSIEIGKSIGLRTNRNSNIIVYHFIRTATPVYKFGVVVNGTNKGQYIEG